MTDARAGTARVRRRSIILGVQAPPSFRDLALGDFAERLASPDPVPGGGSASAVAAALGASLIAMVAELTQGRARYADHAELCEAAVPAARALADELFRIADDDAAAYAACAVALRLPRESFSDQEVRDRQIRETATVAAEVPLRCVERCVAALRIAESLAGRSNRNASSDLRVASLLIEAAADGAAANVLVNLPLIGTNDWTVATAARVDRLVRDATALAEKLREVVASGEARDPLDEVPGWPVH